MPKPFHRPWLDELKDLRKSAGFAKAEPFVDPDIISVKTYRLAESRQIASESTLKKIDKLFKRIGKDESKKDKPREIVIAAAEKWSELREEHRDEKPPVSQQGTGVTPLTGEDSGRANDGPQVKDGQQEIPSARSSAAMRKQILSAAVLLTLLLLVAAVGAWRFQFHPRPSSLARGRELQSLQDSESRLPFPKDVAQKLPNAKVLKVSNASNVTGSPTASKAIVTPSLPVHSLAKSPVTSPTNPVDKKPQPEPKKHSAEKKQEEVVPYAAAFVSCEPFKSKGHPLIHCDPLQELQFEVTVKNTGSEPWVRGHRPISLGVVPGDPPTDKDKIGHGPVYVNWMDTYADDQLGDRNRVYIPWKDVVYPGQSITFRFRLKMPDESGPYPVTLQMVMDGPNIAATPSQDGWFKGESVHATFQVRDLDDEIKNQTP